MSESWKSAPMKLGMWKPQSLKSSDKTTGPDIPKKDAKRSKINLIDKGSIYSIRSKDVAGRDFPMRKRLPSAQEVHLLATDTSNKMERRYINRIRLGSPSSRTFKKHIIQKYHAPPMDKGLGYRMPRPPNEKRDQHEMALEAVRKKPTVIRTATMAALNRPVHCQNNSKEYIYCEILGPATCSACIESTNKCMAEELQRRLFPGIDTSPNSLVAPQVAEVLSRKGDCQGRDFRNQQFIHNGVIDYRATGRNSALTDRLRPINIAVPNLTRLDVTNSSGTKGLRKPKPKLPGLALLLKTML